MLNIPHSWSHQENLLLHVLGFNLLTFWSNWEVPNPVPNLPKTPILQSPHIGPKCLRSPETNLIFLPLVLEMHRKSLVDDLMKSIHSFENMTPSAQLMALTIMNASSISFDMSNDQSGKLKDWNKFADTVRRLFDHVRTEKCFKDKDLTNLVSESRKKTIKTLYEFHKYQRKFIRIGG